MRVAFLSQPRDVVVGRGAEKGSVAIVLMELARRLAARAEITVVSPGAHGLAGEDRFPDGLRILRTKRSFRKLHGALELARGVSGLGQPHFASPFYFKEYGWAAARLLASGRPDLVHIMSYPQFARPIRAALPDARLVLHLHDSAMLHLDRAMALCRLDACAAILTCSDWLRTRLGGRFPELEGRIHTVANGIDADVFKPAPRVGAKGRLRILYVGRVSPEKGIDVLIDAFGQVATQRPEVTLDIVGPVGLLPHSFVRLVAGDPAMHKALPYYGRGLLDRLEKQVLSARQSYRRALEARIPPALVGRVAFVGPVPHDEVAALYLDADVVVVPSLIAEPFGLPAAEAMASGVPVIASGSGALPDIVRDEETGLLVPPGNAPALANALARLAQDPALRDRMGNAGRERAAATLGWTPGVLKLHSIYTHTLEQRSR